METMRIAKRTVDYTMILALVGLGVMFILLLLQGFSVYGFYLDVPILTALVPSLSAAAALRVLGRTGDRFMRSGGAAA